MEWNGAGLKRESEVPGWSGLYGECGGALKAFRSAREPFKLVLCSSASLTLLGLVMPLLDLAPASVSASVPFSSLSP